jgi:hypothetical protein
MKKMKTGEKRIKVMFAPGPEQLHTKLIAPTISHLLQVLANQ